LIAMVLGRPPQRYLPPPVPQHRIRKVDTPCTREIDVARAAAAAPAMVCGCPPRAGATGSVTVIDIDPADCAEAVRHPCWAQRSTR
jgi:hypothetical protein